MSSPLSLPATCAAVTDLIERDAARLTDGYFERACLARPIIRLQSKTRGEYKLGSGLSQSNVRFERSLPDTFNAAGGDPDDLDPWGASATITASAGAGEGCRPPNDTVQFGTTQFAITPRHTSLDTQEFCIRDIQTGFQYADWMSKISGALEYIPQWVWARRFTADYVKAVSLADQMVTLTQAGGGVAGTIDFDDHYITTGAFGKLRQGILDKFYAKLMRDGAALPSGMDEATGAPVFTLITSAETSMDIVRSDPDLREDTRYAYMGKGEMTPLVPGVPFKKKNYGGFIHEIDPYPRRFILQGGAYVEISPFTRSAAHLGYKQEINAAWENAPFEESIIWHEGVYRDLAINTATNIPANWTFTPRSWMGSFSPRNIPDKVCNPDGTMLYFRALFASALEPLNPNLGFSILHGRCAPDQTVRSCYVS